MKPFYKLPKDAIAKFPPEKRGESKLLIVNRQDNSLSIDKYFNLDKYLEPTDLLILNNTKVIKARIFGKKENGTEIEMLILERHSKLQNKIQYRGTLHEGEKIQVNEFAIEVTKILEGGIAEIRSNEDLSKIAEKYGDVPIPPYLKRETTSEDELRYQTEFAKVSGSVAAPTASLNFTDELRNKLIEKGVEIEEITLHVGLGTFLPIRVENVDEHKMHEEFYSISNKVVEKINEAKKNENNIVALGTTVTRALEHGYANILTNKGEVSNEADIFIHPPYQFKLVDKLITNFHSPDSTVIMLTAAFTGETLLKNAYEFALQNDFKFLSYGDSMIII